MERKGKKKTTRAKEEDVKKHIENQEKHIAEVMKKPLTIKIDYGKITNSHPAKESY